ncbi:P-loop NTPase [Solicola gregarius]|uniref:Iron-sulfur cluster carrier protein n=1 Tax=Solicola gregarius TaxID=2908642 RepID=A0AA46TMR2_9ACTN|nr:P-loop NTPase [Solicola gregarius]UYM07789.1 Mrp/NBP35 family ATP-binding protein [Solicola gregarius]
MRTLGARVDADTLARVRTAVGSLVEPSLRHRLDELGMVGDVSAVRGGVRVVVHLPSTALPGQDRLRDAVRAAARVDGVGSVDVEVEPMSDSGRMDVARTLKAAPGLNTLGSRTRVYAVASGKGGVGKSVVTANLAAALAAAGQRVGVIDADVWGYSVPQLFGVREAPVALKGVMLPVRAHDVSLMSVGFFVDDAQPVVWRGPMLHKALEQFVGDVYWGELDVLLLDLPPGTGDVPMSLIELLPDVQLLLVTTPQAAVAAVAGRVAAMATDSRVPVAGVVENMSSISCDGCGAETPLFDGDAGASLAGSLGVPLLGRVPVDRELTRCADAGVPAVLEQPGSPAAVELSRVAATLPSHEPTLAGRSLPLFVSSESS